MPAPIRPVANFENYSPRRKRSGDWPEGANQRAQLGRVLPQPGEAGLGIFKLNSAANRLPIGAWFQIQLVELVRPDQRSTGLFKETFSLNNPASRMGGSGCIVQIQTN